MSSIKTPVSTLSLALIGLTLVSPSVFSASNDSASNARDFLEEIVVTATRIPQNRAELPGDVSVLTRETIAHAGQATLPELLATLPAVEISQNGGAGAVTNVFLRGANGGHTLVLVDGVRMTSATLGSARLEHLPLELVERIEVVRGPMSTLYGADAIGGVIQIFTRRGTGKPRVSASAGLGGYGSKNLDVALTGATDALRYSLGAGYGEQAGFSATNSQAGPYSYNPDKDGYRNQRASLTLDYELSANHRLSLHGLVSEGLTHFDDGVDYGPLPAPVDSTSRARLGTTGLGLNSRLGDAWTSTLRADFASENVRTLGNGYSSRIRMDQWQFAGQLDGKTALGDVQTLLERLEQDIGGDVAYTRTRRTRNALMLGWRREAGRQAFNASVRHDDDSQFGGDTTGALGYSLQFQPDWRGVVSYGTAFRAPAFDDLYWPGAGNPNLRPETSRNLEMGVKYQTGKRSASAIAYRNQVKDLIQWAPSPSGNWLPSNVASANLQGVTLSWQERLGNLSLRASLDLQSPENADTGKLLILRSRQHGSLGADWQTGDWRFSADLAAYASRYNDAENATRLPGYVLLNLAARYRLGKDWSLEGRLANALDVDYSLANGYATPGRNLFVNVRYSTQ